MTTTVINRSLAASYTISELCEIGSAAAFVLSLAFPKGKLVGVLIGALLFLGSVVMQIYAHSVESRAASRLEAERKAGQHVVTEHRLKTLEALRVEADVLDVLALRLGKPALPADDFISWLEEELGTVRAQERLEIILRYTRENAPSSTNPSPMPPPSLSPAAPEGAA
ncbi:MAG TPA: hypothetical protein VH394_00860 [Thermoanaerobaculia bacterium]|jgi:hypothetical protein|nr:hypothetical protein [Thermoanaerobaculia bacterium]